MRLEKVEAGGRHRSSLPLKWWVVGIGVTVIGGGILAAILALPHYY
jgi:hypothetical protein